MKAKRAFAFILSIILVYSAITLSAAESPDGTIVILYTNDVHCAVDGDIGYAGLAAYKKQLQSVYGAEYVTLADIGDAVQGASIGTIASGAYIADIMNHVGYDVITPGNHEFDYGISRLFELTEKQNAAVVSCNFTDLATGKTVFEPYTMISYGGTDVAYIGITTPDALTSSNPSSFRDEKGRYIYGFCEDDTGEALYNAVQHSIDAAVADGADYVVALGHCGIEEASGMWSSESIIRNVTGLDVFIDGHSHSVIACETVTGEDGDPVVLTSSGTKLGAIGEVKISPDGSITAALVTDAVDKDADTDAYIKDIQAQYESLLNTVVARSSVDLTTLDPGTGERAVRSAETNLGDLCADAYRSVSGADIAFVNGGGVRADIKAGDITNNDIISVHPFGNMLCVVEADGREILDALEFGARAVPEETGGFLQVSGLTYEIHTYIKSSVRTDEKGMFVSADGEYRVKNVRILNRETGEYEPLDPDKKYTLASHNYMLKSGGDGYSMFADNLLLQDEVMTDNQVLIDYITGTLGGTVGDEYADPSGQGRITLVREPADDIAAGVIILLYAQIPA